MISGKLQKFPNYDKRQISIFAKEKVEKNVALPLQKSG